MADPKRREGDGPSDDVPALRLGGAADQGVDRISKTPNQQEQTMGYDGQASQTASGSQREIANWESLVAKHQEAQRREAALGDECTRLERALNEKRDTSDDPDEIETAALAVADAERAHSHAGNQCDGLLLQIMATPAPHAEALSYKTEILCGEEYEYIGYAVDGLFEVYAADALFFAGIGKRASSDVLDQFIANLPEFFAEREQRHEASYAEAVAKARAATERARMKASEAASRADIEARFGDWLDAIDAGGGRLLDDDPSKGVYLVWASTNLRRPSHDLPEARLQEIREQRAVAASLTERVLGGGPIPVAVARMRDWRSFTDLNANLEIERSEMTCRMIREARQHGIEEVALRWRRAR